MKLNYHGKIHEDRYLTSDSESLPGLGSCIDSSVLLQGDNACIMRSLLQHHELAGRVDLVYIDPPFATNTVFRIGDERTSTISSQLSDKIAYHDVMQGSEFLEFIRERLILLRELMSAQGSIYLHIDYKIGHYIKIIMDEVFGIQNFRNDIARIKCNPKNFSRKGFGNIKDLILFYTKTNNFIWHEPRVPISESDLSKLYSKISKDGRKYTTVPVHAPGETINGVTSKPWRGVFPPKGRHWRCDPIELDKLDAAGLIEWSKKGNPRRINYADDAIARGKKLQDIWDFKDMAYPDYPTQKNLGMLETIVHASSNENSIVLDCFCGSGTLLVASEKLGRRWIGIDSSDHAIDVAKKRLDGVGIFSKGYVEAKYPV